MFTLANQLTQDCHFVTELPLSSLLIVNDCRYPWCILVPRIDNITELIQLNHTQQSILMTESNWLSTQLLEYYQPDKLNIATIGNVVSQLHLHHVVRFKQDPAWPKPVWGHSPALAYQPADLELFSQRLLSAASLLGNH